MHCGVSFLCWPVWSWLCYKDSKYGLGHYCGNECSDGKLCWCGNFVMKIPDSAVPLQNGLTSNPLPFITLASAWYSYAFFVYCRMRHFLRVGRINWIEMLKHLRWRVIWVSCALWELLHLFDLLLIIFVCPRQWRRIRKISFELEYYLKFSLKTSNKLECYREYYLTFLGVYLLELEVNISVVCYHLAPLLVRLIFFCSMDILFWHLVTYIKWWFAASEFWAVDVLTEICSLCGSFLLLIGGCLYSFYHP